MERKTSERLHRINYLMAETDALYHRAALQLGISDSAMLVLYTVYDYGEGCLLSNVYHLSGASKQTVNSAVRKLEREDILYLKPDGRGKRIYLTQKGKRYAEQTAGRLYATECNALATWTDAEIDSYLFLMEKYAQSLREQIAKDAHV